MDNGPESVSKKLFLLFWLFTSAAFAQNAFQDDAFQDDAFQMPEGCPSVSANPSTAVGQFTSPGNVSISDNVYAAEGTVGDTMAAYDFGLAPITGNQIDGILIELEMDAMGPGGNVQIDVRLSWNAGVNWTAFKTINLDPLDVEAYQSYGGAADTWGRTWAVSDFTNPNFRVAIKYAAEDNAGNSLNLDHARATVYCSAPAGGAGNIRRQRALR